jgi:hypothetical protein
MKFLWSTGQSSWLQIERSRFDSRGYQILLEVVGLEQGPLSLVSIIEEILERTNTDSGLENRNYGRRGSADYATPLCSQKLEITWPTSGGRSVGIVPSRTHVTQLLLFRRIDGMHTGRIYKRFERIYCLHFQDSQIIH